MNDEWMTKLRVDPDSCRLGCPRVVVKEEIINI